MLASEKKPIRQTYRAQLEGLFDIPQYASLTKDIADNARIRNALAHEYPYLRYARVSQVAEYAVELYTDLLRCTKTWIEAQDDPEDAR